MEDKVVLEMSALAGQKGMMKVVKKQEQGRL
jgi:hypothetical protein